MNKENLISVTEQVIISKGPAQSVPLGPMSMALGILNHFTYGSIKEAKDDGIENPKKFKLTVALYLEEIK